MRTALRTLASLVRAPNPLSVSSSPRSFFRTMAATTTAHAPVLKQPVRLACVQLNATADKADNLRRAHDRVLESARNGAKIVVLPECFNGVYGCAHFPKYAEELLPSPPTREQSPSFHALSAVAREAGVYLIAGSIPELVVAEEEEEGAAEAKKRYYNTSLTFDPSGSLIATHRKVHLFDIDIPGKFTFRESDVLSPGNKLTVVDLPEYGKVGVAICYDIRFTEMALVAARRGAFALVYPGAFNLTTGPLHWRLQGQARAMDNQLYVALCSPARDMASDFHAYGHSMVVDPMAQVLAEAGEAEDIVYADLTGDKIEETRRSIPLRDQRRFDLYPDIAAGKIQFEDPELK
ncbi:uncharacterized protein E0L32_012115 [Thyridium curvatum]|uniref:CN hydrolase domain-containing protein n=1 Tax=Thyridium curvatum TaxID=1093900 RepID=A0A507BKG1_9PEZI|nr:uncharacterized protein E0L32_012115 [Thyridium curvatum]TPX17581.1 hypothetical protein E0L32_012115 [Thyridium curvatum]